MPDQTQNPTPHAGAPRSRSVAALWGSGAVAATILVLGVNGTLSSWTSAVIANDTNTVKTAAAVILSETSGANTCFSSDAPTTNNYTCTTINKYGGTAAPLSPGQQKVTDITFKNVGDANAASFAVAPGACTQTPEAGTETPTVADLCASGDLTVAVSCTAGATFDGVPWIDLAYTAAKPPTAAATHTALVGDLNSGAQWTCRFTVKLAGNASVLAQGVTVSQPLTWTLSQS
ncbi:hypothetical protein [Nocardioides sp.]|uniref:hypothetical protein n=1 Tax=Nocardioides sp. TaxID=35761 RepID=UPI002B2786C9|nr:hypothetical protein [Nocardioides sp.]